MTSANTTQEDFWFRNDDGSLTTATYMGSQNSNQTLSPGVFRIRIIAEENNSKQDPWAFQIYARKNNDAGGFTEVTTTRTDGLRYADDSNSIADGTIIGTADFDLTWTGSPVAGEYDDAQTSAGTNTIGLNGQYTELEFCLEIVDGTASDGDFWDLQMYSTVGTSLAGYTRTPRVTASVTTPVTITGTTGSLSFTGQQASIEVPRIINGNLGTLSFTGQQANILTETTINGNLGSITLSPQQSTIDAPVIISGNLGSLSLSGIQGSIDAPINILGNFGTLSLSGLQASLDVPITIGGNLGSLTLSGQTGLVGAITRISSSLGTLTLSSQQGSINAPIEISSNLGSLTLSGLQANLTPLTIIPGSLGSFTLTGQSASILAGTEIFANVGLLTLSGQQASLVTPITITSILKALSLTGFQGSIQVPEPVIIEVRTPRKYASSFPFLDCNYCPFRINRSVARCCKFELPG